MLATADMWGYLVYQGILLITGNYGELRGFYTKAIKNPIVHKGFVGKTIM